MIYMAYFSHGRGINCDMILFVVLTHAHRQNKQQIVQCIHFTIEQWLRKNAVGFTIVIQHNSCIHCLQTLMSNLFCFSNLLTVKQEPFVSITNRSLVGTLITIGE